MGVNLSIKNVPDPLAEKLRQRAEANHRSLQGELMAMLEATVMGEDRAAQLRVRASKTAGKNHVSRGAVSIAEIGAALRQICPVNADLPKAKTSAEIVRRMRDGRDGTQWRDPKHHLKGY
jgi:plasmid stability protein